MKLRRKTVKKSERKRPARKIDRTRKPASRVLATVYEAAVGLYEAGVLSEKKMREFEASCLTPMDSASRRSKQL